MSFEIIDTQEKFDAAIGERLKRERETISKRFADYEDIKRQNAEYAKQIGDMTKAADEAAQKHSEYDKQISEMQSRIKGYETDSVKTRIAHEMGIPFELASRLSGEDEEAIRKDAETMAKFVKGKPTAPLKSTDSTAADSKTAAFRALTASLTNNN